MATKNVDGQYGNSTTYEVEIPTAMLAVGNTPPAPVTVAPFRGYAYTIGDDSYFTIPLPVDYETDSLVTLYVRWGVNENFAVGSAQVQWQAEFDIVSNTLDSIGENAKTVIQKSGDIDIPTTARQVQETAVAVLDERYITSGDTIGVTLSRIAIDTGTEPVQEPEIYKVWLQYTRFQYWGNVAG